MAISSDRTSPLVSLSAGRMPGVEGSVFPLHAENGFLDSLRSLGMTYRYIFSFVATMKMVKADVGIGI